jgi:hypothetical protein
MLDKVTRKIKHQKHLYNNSVFALSDLATLADRASGGHACGPELRRVMSSRPAWAT